MKVAKLAFFGFLMAGVPAFIAYSYHGYHIYGTLDRSGKAIDCPPTAPIYVNFQNYTTTTVRGASFLLEMFEGHNSSDLLSDTYFEFEQIVPRFSSQHFCYAHPYIDQIIGVEENGAEKEESTDGFIRVELSSEIQKVNAVRELGDKFNVYISDLRVETID